MKKNEKREYGRYRYLNMSEEKKKRLKEYQKERLREQTRDKYRNLSEEGKNKKRIWKK